VFDAWPSHINTAKNACSFSARHGHKKQPEIAEQCADALAYCGFGFPPGETFQVLKPGRSARDAWPSHIDNN